MDVTEVHVILAYNKDEDRNGIEQFDRLSASMPGRIADTANLSVERWNLTTIVGKVSDSLLSPSLLPQKFFSQFSYICAQFADFRHGSDEWTNQLVPNWRRFLEELLWERADERCVRLLPVALLILQEHGKTNRTLETGWIDLMEWGMIAAWNVANVCEKGEIKTAVAHIWISFYVAELDRYYHNHAADLAVDYSLHKHLSDSLVDAVATAVIAHWHTARLGILGAAYAELLPRDSDEATETRQRALIDVSNWLVRHLIANPAAMRPVLDIHHIELFLAWAVFMQVGRDRDVYRWLLMLIDRLSVRRAGLAEIPFIEGSNRIELVFECVALGKKPPEFCDGSSVYVVCLMELLCALPERQRNELLENVYLLLAQGTDSAGEAMEGIEPLNLMLWIPPADWSERVLTKTLADEGECAGIHLNSSGETTRLPGTEIAASIENAVRETREKREFKYPSGLPLSVVVLACLKHRSPLPPELWRRAVFEERRDGLATDTPIRSHVPSTEPPLDDL